MTQDYPTLRDFLEAQGAETLQGYLEPYDADLEAALATRLTWASEHYADPEHGPEARYLLANHARLRRELTRTVLHSEQPTVVYDPEDAAVVRATPPPAPRVHRAPPWRPPQAEVSGLLIAAGLFFASFSVLVLAWAVWQGRGGRDLTYLPATPVEVPTPPPLVESRPRPVSGSPETRPAQSGPAPTSPSSEAVVVAPSVLGTWRDATGEVEIVLRSQERAVFSGTGIVLDQGRLHRVVFTGRWEPEGGAVRLTTPDEAYRFDGHLVKRRMEGTLHTTGPGTIRTVVLVRQ